MNVFYNVAVTELNKKFTSFIGAAKNKNYKRTVPVKQGL